MSAAMYPVCGKCNVLFRLHPVESCPYNYRTDRHNGRIVGYYMTDKKNKKNGRTEKEKEKSPA